MKKFMKCSLPVKKNAKFCFLDFTKFQFLEKLRSLVHLGSSFLTAWIFGIIYEILQKDLSKNEVYKF